MTADKPALKYSHLMDLKHLDGNCIAVLIDNKFYDDWPGRYGGGDDSYLGILVYTYQGEIITTIMDRKQYEDIKDDFRHRVRWVYKWEETISFVEDFVFNKRNSNQYELMRDYFAKEEFV